MKNKSLNNCTKYTKYLDVTYIYYNVFVTKIMVLDNSVHDTSTICCFISNLCCWISIISLWSGSDHLTCDDIKYINYSRVSKNLCQNKPNEKHAIT